jgi:pimeloyl-ACP methyl ester carboxylesterase
MCVSDVTTVEANLAMRQQLVMIPGLLCSAALYAEQVASLSDIADITVADHTKHDTMAAIATSILAKSPPTFALVGLSMGGYIALEIMRQAPERVTKLALLDTNAQPDPPERAAVRRALCARADMEGIAPVSASLLPQWVHPDRLSDKALVATVGQMAATVGITAFRRQIEAIITRIDSRPSLAAIKVPTLVLVGREDQATPVAQSEEIARGIRGSRLVILERCGHLTTMERPAEVTAELRVWLGI